MTQQQTQSQFSRTQSRAQSQAPSSESADGQGPSLSSPASPDATSPYDGPAEGKKAEQRPEHVADKDGPEAMEQPHFSEAQSTFGAFEPVERPGDPFAEPEDQLPATLTSQPTEQPAASGSQEDSGQEFKTPAGTVRAGMSVIDSYGHPMGVVSSVDGERLRLASSDPHDDGVSFLPVSLIDGIEGDRILLGGRGDASFGMSGE